MSSTQRLSISARIWILLGAFALCLLASIMVALSHSSQQLRQSAGHAAAVVVESAQGILKHYHQLEQDGQLTRAEAQARAIAGVEALRFDNGNYVFLHQDNGVAISIATSPKLVGKDLNDLQDPNGVYIVRGIREAAMEGGGFTHYQWPSPSDKNTLIEKTTYSSYFKPWGWIVGSGVNMGRLDAEVSAVRQEFIITTLVALAVMGIIGVFLIRSITTPLKRSIAAMRDLASGDGDLTHKLPETGPKELVALAHHFNYFSATIRELVMEVASASRMLGQSSQGLLGVTQTTEHAVQNQQAGAEQLAAAMNEMVQTVNEVARHAENAASTTDTASGQTDSSRQVVNQAMADIDALADTMTQSSQAIARLADESRNIDQVLDVIRAIAEQTNLLALNAAIEAARAGEAGRGFAVVADEVRTLAQRTQDSTSEIQTIIESLQNGTQMAVESMQTGVNRAQASAEVSGNVEESLDSIAAAIQSVRDMTTQIASAAEEQAATAEEINRSVIDIRDQSAGVSGEAGKTSTASEEISAIAGRMNTLIERFRV